MAGACLLFTVRPALAIEEENGSAFLDGSGYLRPRASPDGKAIAYLQYDLEGKHLSLRIRSLSAGSTGERVLAQQINDASDLAWRPSGGALAVLRMVEGRTRLYVVSDNGNVLRSIPLPPESIEGGLAWLADSDRVVVGTRTALLIMNITSGDLISRIDLAKAGLSPDLGAISVSARDRLAFTASRSGAVSGGSRVWIIDEWNADPSPKPITAGPTDSSPQWIGDSAIVFSRDDASATWKRGSAQFSLRHLWKVSLADGAETELTHGQVRDDYPTWISGKGIVVFSRVPFYSLKADQEKTSSELVPSKPLSTILTSISREVLFLARESRVAWIPMS